MFPDGNALGDEACMHHRPAHAHQPALSGRTATDQSRITHQHQMPVAWLVCACHAVDRRAVALAVTFASNPHTLLLRSQIGTLKSFTLLLIQGSHPLSCQVGLHVRPPLGIIYRYYRD